MQYHTLLCNMGKREEAKIIQIISTRGDVNNREALKLAAAMLEKLNEEIESHLRNSHYIPEDDNVPID